MFFLLPATGHWQPATTYPICFHNGEILHQFCEGFGVIPFAEDMVVSQGGSEKIIISLGDFYLDLGAAERIHHAEHE